MDTTTAPLGSLAQASRTRQLKVARWILIVVGILHVLFYGFMYSNAEEEVETVFKQQMRAEGLVVTDQALFDSEKAKAVKTVRLIYAVVVALAVGMVICGLLVYKAPVPATMTGLIIYVGMVAAFVYFDASNLYKGIIIKVLVIVALVKAVQAAIAYHREAAALGEGGPSLEA